MAPPPVIESIVYASDGAGDFRISSTQLRKVVQEDCLPIYIVPFIWSHGYGRVVRDQVDVLNYRIQGKLLADEVLAFHEANPKVPIYLTGHSAGCSVTLAALENLPPGVVERGVLMSAAMTACYDLRPALATVKEGIYVFHSRRDLVYLGAAMRLMKGMSRECSVAAGRVGYRMIADTDEDIALYSKLHQRAWTPDDRATGNLGGHYGNYQPDFLRQEVMPLLRGAEPTGPAAIEFEQPEEKK